MTTPNNVTMSPDRNPGMMAFIRDHSPLSLGGTKLTASPSGFSEDLVIVQASDVQWPKGARMRFLLHKPTGASIHLDGDAGAIHALNKMIGLRLRKVDVASYLRFFSGHVHGDQGPFHVVEHPADLVAAWGTGAGDPWSFEDELNPVNVEGRSPAWTAEAHVLYGRGLFKATFRVMRSGVIEMVEDEPVREDVGVAPVLLSL